MFFSVFYDFSQLELGSWMLDCIAQHPNNPKNSSISFRSNFKVNQSTHKKTLQIIQFIIEKIAIFIYFPIHHPTGLKNGFSKKKIILGSRKKKDMKNYAIDILKNRNRNVIFLSSTGSSIFRRQRKKNPISHQLWHRNKEGAREYIISSKSYCGFLFRLADFLFFFAQNNLLIFLYIRRSMTIN